MRQSTTRAPSSTSAISAAGSRVAAGVRAAHLGEVVRQPLDGGGRREDLGVGGGHEAQHGRTSVSMVGRSDGAPPSISAARRSVSRWSAIRSPSASWRSSRAAAKRRRAGDEAPPARGRDPRQQRAAEGVVLERAVPRRAEHGTDRAAVGLAVVGLRAAARRRGAAPGRGGSRSRRPRRRAAASGPLRRRSTLSGANVVVTGSRPRPATAPRRDSTSSSMRSPSSW